MNRASGPSEQARLCEGRVCVVTGAGGGIGRQHALMLAEHGGKVIVNDVGARLDGSGASVQAAQDVVDEIVAAGGEAVADTSDISSWDGAEAVIARAVDTYGRLDVLVNNAGILRDRMIVNLSEDDWDSVIRVHLKGTFATTRWAAAHWREQAKAGVTNDARIINTTSGSGLFGAVGQANYGAAKAAIAALSIIGSMELGRYGATVNAISPIALTRMTEGLPVAAGDDEEQGAIDPRWVAVLVTWLASTKSAGVTGKVLRISGRGLSLVEGWTKGPEVAPADEPAGVDPLVRSLLAG